MLKMLLICFVLGFYITSIKGQCNQCCISDVSTYASCFKHCQTACICGINSAQEYAHKKPTMQSSTHIQLGDKTHTSDFAVDGDKSADFRITNCTHTNTENHPWWSVDLQANVRVLFLNVTNRGDCCSDRLKNVHVYVSSISGDPATATDKKTCVFHRPSVGAETITLECTTPLIGRYVIIRLEYSAAILAVCEVEVFGCKSD